MAVSDAAVNDPGLIINKGIAGEVPAFCITLDKYTRIRFVFTYNLQNGPGFWFFIDYMDENGVWHEDGTERIDAPNNWVELNAITSGGDI